MKAIILLFTIFAMILTKVIHYHYHYENENKNSFNFSDPKKISLAIKNNNLKILKKIAKTKDLINFLSKDFHTIINILKKSNKEIIYYILTLFLKNYFKKKLNPFILLKIAFEISETNIFIIEFLFENLSYELLNTFKNQISDIFDSIKNSKIFNDIKNSNNFKEIKNSEIFKSIENSEPVEFIKNSEPIVVKFLKNSKIVANKFLKNSKSVANKFIKKSKTVADNFIKNLINYIKNSEAVKFIKHLTIFRYLSKINMLSIFFLINLLLIY